jgi:hypothetical protein
MLGSKTQPAGAALRGLRMSFKMEPGEKVPGTEGEGGEGGEGETKASAAAAGDGAGGAEARPKNVLCPNCGMGNEVPEGKTFFNCASCGLEMVAKLSDVPKTSRLQCPNCSRSIVAPPNCDMFKCICGQTMVVPGSEMAKRIQKQGTREGERIFVQDKSALYGAIHLRVTSKKIFKKWSERFFSIQRGRLLLFRSKLKAAQGNPAVLVVGLHARQVVSAVSDTTNKNCDLLHMLTLRENVSDGNSGSPRGSAGHAFSEAFPSRVACELAANSIEAAEQLREKIESAIHKMQEESRRDRR